MQVKYIQNWANTELQKESACNFDEGVFPHHSLSVDVMGDTMDEYSSTISTELKAIALWGGEDWYKSVLMSYNDYKCADSIITAIKGPNAFSGPRDYDNVLHFAQLIAKNRDTLVQTGQIKSIAITEKDRRDLALKAYKNKKFFFEISSQKGSHPNHENIDQKHLQVPT